MSLDTKQRWLVVSNCQAAGLAGCLQMLCDDLHLTYHDPGTLKVHKDAVLRSLASYDRILLAPPLEPELQPALQDVPPESVWRVPPIYFVGYHPDICNLSPNGVDFMGPLGHYHSAIGYAAFRCGLSAADAASLFREETFEQLGYFEAWDAARESLLGNFRATGFDLSQQFVQWSRRGPFMLTMNHPKIECLRDIAEAILRRAGLPVRRSEFLPPDNLANGPAYPTYPPLASRLGIAGSYLFKYAARPRLMDLDQFLDGCFQTYAKTDRAAAIPEAYRPLVQNAVRFIESR